MSYILIVSFFLLFMTGNDKSGVSNLLQLMGYILLIVAAALDWAYDIDLFWTIAAIIITGVVLSFSFTRRKHKYSMVFNTYWMAFLFAMVYQSTHLLGKDIVIRIFDSSFIAVGVLVIMVALPHLGVVLAGDKSGNFLQRLWPILKRRVL